MPEGQEKQKAKNLYLQAKTKISSAEALKNLSISTGPASIESGASCEASAIDSPKSLHTTGPAATEKKGTQRIGPYEFNWKDDLGKGVVGNAYLGYHVNDKSKVVFRVVNQDSLNDSNMKQLVENDRDIVLSLQDKQNIVKFLFYMDIPPNLYFVMEFCEHTSLERYMEQHIPNRRTRLIIMKQCIEFLAYLHSLQPCLIHRCIQPELILLKGDIANPVIKFIDFHYAVYVKDEPITEMVGGQNYMAPEMFLFDEYDAKVDVFSLGCVFLGMIHFGTKATTMMPYSETTLQGKSGLSKTKPLGLELVEAHKRKKSIGPILDISGVDNYDWWNDVKATTLKMLQYDPKERITAEEAAEQLKAL